MRVLLVGNLYGRDDCASFYMIMQKLVHGFARAGHAVQVFNDREVARAANIFRARKLGVRTANRRLLRACVNFRPDLVLLGHCEMIGNDTVAAIRRAVPDARIVYRNVDPLHDPRNRARIARRAPAVDAVFLTTAGEAAAAFADSGTPIHFMPNPVDPAVETLRAFARGDQAHDLFFAISAVIDARDPRLAMANRLETALPEVAFDFRGMKGRPSQRGAAYFDLLAEARMGLSFSRVNDHYLYSSDRMAQYLGNGLLTFVDRATGFGELFAADELGLYGDFDELVDKIRHFRANDGERRRVAERGWRKAHAMFDPLRVVRYIEEVTFAKNFSSDYEWPTHAWTGRGEATAPRSAVGARGG